jgi:putative hydrolase of the HAD superfamily
MGKTNQITTLFLDVGGVLLTNGWDNGTRQKAIEQFHLDAKEVDDRHHLAFDIYEEGKLTLDEYLEQIVFYEPRTFSSKEFKEFMYSQSQPYPDMINMVRTLKSKYSLKTFTVNNEGRELNAYRIKTFKLYEFIDAFVSSCFVHFRKPDEDIFKVALDISQTPPEQVMYIDDREMFTEVAAKLGMHSIHHLDFNSTREKLAEVGLISSGV